MGLITSFPGGNGGGSGLPSGGTTGQVLSKKSNTDGDVKWVNPVSTDYCFKTSDGYMGEASFYDIDAMPIFTGSTIESRVKKLATWGKIKLALKAYFDTLYSSVKTRGTPASGGTDLSLVTTGDMYNWNNPSVPIAANQFDKANIYSTTEKIVGCWTDGRPIYQKTVSFGTLPDGTSAKSVAHGISNLNKVINTEINCKHGSINMNIEVPFIGWVDTARQAIGVKINETNIIIQSSYYYSEFTADVTLRYTKTTDAANSFNYADENDYSTNEKIVGTWIDGKPVYQRTFSESNVSLTNHKYQKTISGLKIKQIVRCSSYLKGGNGYGFAGGYSGASPSDFYASCWTYSDDLYLSLNYKDSNTVDYLFTIQYTKTTD